MKKLNTKYIKTGGYSVLISLVVLAIVIVVNVFVSKAPATVTQIDLSSNETFSISDKTIDTVDSLKKDVMIYYVVDEGQEDKYYQTMLGKYDGLSVRLTVKNIDPGKNPNFFKGDRAGASSGTLIVECGDRTKLIEFFDVYYPGIAYDQIVNYYYSYGSLPGPTGFDMENQLTSAISFVTSDISPVIYTLTGHGEMGLDNTYKGYLESEAMELKELNLGTAGAVPEDADCILVCVPEKDISEKEAELLLDYLKKGGKMMYYSYYAYAEATEHTNLQKVLEYYGVTPSEGIIYEGDSNYHLADYPMMMIPNFGEHEIVTPFKGYAMFLGMCQGINISEELRESLTVDSLFKTSDKAFARIEESESNTKIDSDIAGPFDYGVAISELVDAENETRIVWINTPIVLLSSYDYYYNYETLFLNAFGWLLDAEDVISIPSKDMTNQTLEITAAQGKLFLAVFAVIIPAVFVVAGAYVWYRRRSK